MRQAIIAVALALTSSGCGLIFQGFTQDVPVMTDPVGAVATIGEQSLSTPATFTVRRRTAWRVIRAEAPGHGPGCFVLRCPMNRALRILDSIPLFIPLAFDASLGTLARCPAAPLLRLPAMPPGVDPYVLPDDAALIQAARGVVDICTMPHQYDAKFLGRAQGIMVTTGQVAVDYEPVGTVDVVLPGFDSVHGSTTGTFVRSGIIGLAGATTTTYRVFHQADTGQANNALRAEALLRYGPRVNAIINVEYMTNPKNDVNATGLAVRLVGKDG